MSKPPSRRELRRIWMWFLLTVSLLIGSTTLTKSQEGPDSDWREVTSFGFDRNAATPKPQDPNLPKIRVMVVAGADGTELKRGTKGYAMVELLEINEQKPYPVIASAGKSPPPVRVAYWNPDLGWFNAIFFVKIKVLFIFGDGTVQVTESRLGPTLGKNSYYIPFDAPSDSSEYSLAIELDNRNLVDPLSGGDWIAEDLFAFGVIKSEPVQIAVQ